MIRDEINVSHSLIRLKAKCSACQKPTHLLESCNLLHFCPDKEKIIKKYEFSHPQERFPFKRADKKKKNRFFKALKAFTSEKNLSETQKMRIHHQK